MVGRGDVVLWEIRGMGVSKKARNYHEATIDEIENYFLDGIQQMLEFYNHKNFTMICHSFSAYLIFLYSVRSRKPFVSKMVLLSPIGITPK